MFHTCPDITDTLIMTITATCHSCETSICLFSRFSAILHHTGEGKVITVTLEDSDHIRKDFRKHVCCVWLRVPECVSVCVCVTLSRAGVVAGWPKNIVLNTEPERAVTIPDLSFRLNA